MYRNSCVLLVATLNKAMSIYWLSAVHIKKVRQVKQCCFDSMVKSKVLHWVVAEKSARERVVSRKAGVVQER